MRRKKKPYYRIGELSQMLGVKPYVIRYWEQEFGLTTKRGLGYQRQYTDEDLKLFQEIKRLLYEERYTIAGAKRKIKGEGSEVNYKDLLKETCLALKEVLKILKS